MNLRSTDEAIVMAGRSDCCPVHARLADHVGIAPTDRHRLRVRIVRPIRTINATEWNYFDAPPELGEVFLAREAGGLIACTSTSEYVERDDGKAVGESSFALWPELGDAFLSAFRDALGKPDLLGVEMKNIPAFGDRTAEQKTRWQ